MDRTDVDWKGYWASCPTPFRADDESLDLDALRRLLEFYVSCGLHGVLINGTVGEWFSQTEPDRKAVAETAVEAVAGRMTVVIGCTAYTAREIAGYGRHAMLAGADGIEVSAPPYSKPFPDELVRYYQDVCEAVDAPLMVYNWNVVAVKDSTPDAEQFFETTRRVVGRARVFGPFMTQRGLEMLQKYGGDGFIGGGSLFGAADAQFWRSYWSGDITACQEYARRNEELFPKLWLPGGWAGVHGAYQSELKAVMAMLGQPGGATRRPRLPVSDPARLAEIRSVLVESGLLPG
jgi:1-pyrroline-4-hydroxy-2-carboxylate deaminase